MERLHTIPRLNVASAPAKGPNAGRREAGWSQRLCRSFRSDKMRLPAVPPMVSEKSRQRQLHPVVSREWPRRVDVQLRITSPRHGQRSSWPLHRDNMSLEAMNNIGTLIDFKISSSSPSSYPMSTSCTFKSSRSPSQPLVDVPYPLSRSRGLPHYRRH